MGHQRLVEINIGPDVVEVRNHDERHTRGVQFALVDQFLSDQTAERGQHGRIFDAFIDGRDLGIK